MAEARIECIVVDDQPTLRHALVESIRRLGHGCREAASAIEALELLEANEPHVVVSDIRMPEMDGVALLERIRRRFPDVAVIMLTGVADVDTAVGCLRVGAFDYIIKPFQLDEVHARVLQAAEKRRLILDNRRYQHHLAELVQQQAHRIEELFVEGIQSIVHALEAKDRYTQGHSARVSAYAGRTARTIGLTRDEVQLIELGAELHDVGKIGVSETVLNKRGKLTDEEYRHVMEHTVIGARILDPLMRNVQPVLDITRSHHERLDGTGLPDGLAGDHIPLHARIVSVVDAFDAMTSDRSYRSELTPRAAIEELEAHRDTQFDPEVVSAFLTTYPDLGALPIPTPRITRRELPRGVSGAQVPVEPVS